MEHAIDPKSGREAPARGLEVDIAGAGVVRFANEQVHEADNRWLIREIADVRRKTLVAGLRLLQRHRLFVRCQASDPHVEIFWRGRLGSDGALIGDAQIIECLEQGVLSDRDRQRSVRPYAGRTDLMVHEKLARNAIRHWHSFRSVAIRWHRTLLRYDAVKEAGQRLVRRNAPRRLRLHGECGNLGIAPLALLRAVVSRVSSLVPDSGRTVMTYGAEALALLSTLRCRMSVGTQS